LERSTYTETAIGREVSIDWGIKKTPCYDYSD
jgi:hypothetical protein